MKYEVKNDYGLWFVVDTEYPFNAVATCPNRAMSDLICTMLNAVEVGEI